MIICFQCREMNAQNFNMDTAKLRNVMKDLRENYFVMLLNASNI